MTISGTVTDVESGAPVEGIKVSAVPTVASSTDIPPATTDADGRYAIAVTAGAGYRLGFQSGRTITHWYGGGETAASGTVVAPSTSTVRSVTVKAGGRVEGTYTGTTAGYLFRAIKADGVSATGAATAADGRFEVWLTSEQPVRVGSIMMGATGLRTLRWHGGKYSATHATPIQVGSGQTVTGLSLDASDATATVSGRVTNVTGVPLRFTNITALVAEDGEWVPVGQVARSAETTGAYRTLVPAGEEVTLRVDAAGRDDGYRPTWLGNTEDVTAAPRLQLAAGDTLPDTDIAVAGGDPVTGTVQDAFRLPVPGVVVTLFFQHSDIELGTAVTDDEGRFEVPGLGYLSTGAISARYSGEHLVTSWSGNKTTQAQSQVIGEHRTFGAQTVSFDPEHTLPEPEAPTLSGSGLVGTVLSATPGAGSPDATEETLRWYCGDRALGATGPTYPVTAADAGCSDLHVRQVASREGWGNGVTRSRSVTARRFEIVDRPVVYGSGPVGERARILHLRWSAPPERISYQWMRDGVPISGATASTYAPARADLGRLLSVRITGHRPADGLTFTKFVRSATKVRTKTTIRTNVISRRGRADIALRVTTPGVLRPGGLVRVARTIPGGGDQTIKQFWVGTTPQTLRYTLRRAGTSRLIITYTGSATASPVWTSILVVTH